MTVPAPPRRRVLAEVRPGPPLASWAALAAVTAALLAAAAGQRGGAPDRVAVLLLAALATASGGAGLLLLCPPRLRLTPRAVVHRSGTGRVAVAPRARLAAAVLAPVSRTPGRPDGALLVLVDRDGRALLRVAGPRWDPVQLARFAGATGVPVSLARGPVTRGDLRAAHPGALLPPAGLLQGRLDLAAAGPVVLLALGGALTVLGLG